MILVRSPLRVTLGGGGSDLPSYYRQYGGFCLSAAIDKFVYVAVTRPFEPGIYLKYSQLEHVEKAADVQHPIIRAVLDHVFPCDRIEITTLADVPAGTGLGSSSSFTTALIAALAAHHRFSLSASDIAKAACDVELNMLKAPIGKQDQYAAAFGGLNALTFNEDDTVGVQPAAHPPELEDYLLLFFTGYTRQADTLLVDQDQRTKDGDESILKNLHSVKGFGQMSAEALKAGALTEFGMILDCQWREKVARQGVSPEIYAAYKAGKESGALGGKLIGAGGGGFLMFYTEDPRRLRTAMKQIGLEELRFNFDYKGTVIVS